MYIRRLNLRAARIDISHLLPLAAGAFTLLYNQAFYKNAAQVYADTGGGLAFMLSLTLFLFAVTLLLLSLLCFRYVTKPVLITVTFAAAAASFYMNGYNVVIDTTMITNMLKTDTREVGDLLNANLLLKMCLLGLLPALLIWKLPIRCAPFGVEVVRRVKLIALSLALILLAIVPFTSNYASFFREHKILRYYANPATPLYSAFRYVGDALEEIDTRGRMLLGLDARIPAADTSRELVILVVGEAARADHFALNGYERATNPLLAREDIINFPHVTSCGTATAYSLPCMFSLSNRADFDLDEDKHKENALDVLNHAGVSVLWRDNNSDSKGVADGVTFQDFRSPDVNPECDVECRDVGMLHGLPEYIAARDSGDIVIVLHQMGNHGPAYYKRYPAEFEQFAPVCRTTQLENCSDAEIRNAYDNAILYTDWFLAQVIAFLKNYDDDFETAMYYMSDHGESLGENGLYLHGLPYMLAPQTQKHVASLMWFGAAYRVDRVRMKAAAVGALSHDNYFHTVLGLLEVGTTLHEPSLDLVIHRDQGEPGSDIR
jgi:lipid A ethanolaminephosphotransferase